MIKSIIEIIKDIFWLIVRGRKKADENQIPNAVDQARADAANGNDAALAADLDAARQRMLDNQSRSSKQ